MMTMIIHVAMVSELNILLPSLSNTFAQSTFPQGASKMARCSRRDDLSTRYHWGRTEGQGGKKKGPRPHWNFELHQHLPSGND